MRFFTTVVSLAIATFAAAQSTTVATATAAPTAAPTGGVEAPSLGGNAIIFPIAGDTITAGETVDIKWTNTVGSTITLVLVSGPSGSVTPVATIVANIDNNGVYSWDAPVDLPASDSYSIRISYDSNPNNYNYSDRFVYVSDATAVPTTSTASSTAPPTTSASSSSATTESETSSTESTTSEATTETSSTSTLRTSTSTRRTSSSTSESTSAPTDGAPPNAAGATLSSPLAVIMAVLAAALFIH